MKLACFLSLVACVAGFGSFDGAEDAPTVSTEPEETCESLIARGADLTCSACCPNECAEFDYTNADAYKTDANEGDDFFATLANFSTYAYDFRGHDGCVCFNDKSFNSDYGSVHLTEGNDCALVISNADIHGLGGDDTLMSLSPWGNNNIYGGAGDDHVKVLGGWEGYVDPPYYATRVEGGDGEDSVVIYRGGAVVDGDVETLTFDEIQECTETGAESGARIIICEYDYDYDYES